MKYQTEVNWMTHYI